MVRRKGQSKARTFSTEAEAVAWADATEAQFLTGKPTSEGPAGVFTVTDLFDRYAREISPSKGGARWEIIRLRKLAQSPTFQVPVTALDGPAMADWRDARLQEVSAGSVKRKMSLVSAVLTRAMKEWRCGITVNPIHTIEWPRQPHARRRRVSPDERAAIMAALGWDGTSAPVTRRQWVAWGFLAALETMMRQSEVLKLTWDHVDLTRCVAHLPKTKNGEHRDVPLSTSAVALLRLLPEGRPGERVCKVNAGTFGGYFRRATKAAGIVDLHFHNSRREALTQASKKLNNVAELARASGHRSLRSLMIYYEPDASELAAKLG